MRLNSLKSTFDEYKGWIVLLVTGYVLWCFRGLFTSLGSTAGALADQATAGVRETAQTAAAKAKVKASGGSPARHITDDDVATYQADAKSLAAMLGHDKFSVNTLLKDRKGAFALLKRSYSRLSLYNNKPFTSKLVKGKHVLTTHDVETPQCVKGAVNWRVLVPFYEEATGGGNLLSDLRSDLDIPEYRPWIKWII